MSAIINNQQMKGLVPSREVSAEPMTGEEMRRRLGDGEDALDLSLEKWRRILRRSTGDEGVRELVGRGHVYLGEASCALCETATRRHREEKGSGFTSHAGKCDFCPLARLEACGASNSAYMRLRNASAHPARFREETRRFLRLLWTCKKMSEDRTEARESVGEEAVSDGETSADDNRLAG